MTPEEARTSYNTTQDQLVLLLIDLQKILVEREIRYIENILSEDNPNYVEEVIECHHPPTQEFLGLYAHWDDYLGPRLTTLKLAIGNDVVIYFQQQGWFAKVENRLIMNNCIDKTRYVIMVSSTPFENTLPKERFWSRLLDYFRK
jgi:hypothetical protein